VKSIFLGIVQGLTEFLPISSSGHLYLIKNILNINEDYFSFFVFLHIPTLIAVLFFFSKEIKFLKDLRLVAHIIFICVITGIIGFGINLCFRSTFGNSYFLSFCFFVNALILFNTKGNITKRNWKDLNLKDSFLIGLLQGLAPLPGISRSGITIAILLRRGFSKNDSFMLSFLIAIPLMVGVFIFDLRYFMAGSFWAFSAIISFIFAFLSGILALGVLKRVIIMEKVSKFAYYCLFLSLLRLLMGLIK